jgi:hypothetical protein
MKKRLLWFIPSMLLGFVCQVEANPLPFTCQQINAENIAAGTADANGYTLGVPGIAVSGIWNVPNAPTVVDLPPNGIVCVKSLTGGTGTVRTLRFNRNARNTPVYLLAEDFLSLGALTVDVSGGQGVSQTAMGLTILGGVGGPGGSDGGSCDLTVTNTPRMSDGQGPGGGKGRATLSAGGGASAVSNGGNGFSSGAVGGSAPSLWEHQLLFGGYGGGCGFNHTNTSVYGSGGGGGGVVVLATNGQLNTGNTSGGVRATGGTTSPSGGGGAGGGGVIRLIATSIDGTGQIDVRGAAGTSSCGTSSFPGGCGGVGLVKFEGPIVNGVLAPNVNAATLNTAINTNGEAAVKFGVARTIVPTTPLRPQVRVLSITSNIDGTPQAQTVPLVTSQLHPHLRPTVVVAHAAQMTVTVETTHVPTTATVFVKVNYLDNAPTTGSNQIVSASNPTGTGPTKTWTATFTVPSGMKLGTVDAWVTSVCTPGAANCPPVP